MAGVLAMVKTRVTALADKTIDSIVRCEESVRDLEVRLIAASGGIGNVLTFFIRSRNQEEENGLMNHELIPVRIRLCKLEKGQG
ncbi:hypothetical protein Sjap_019354 [Stephania japonica]|uniref:Uncharacterized protein n=1 Tax=Stephania japonica TaxID=461633 RepID=A0AAP0EYL0_9MAGN